MRDQSIAAADRMVMIPSTRWPVSGASPCLTRPSLEFSAAGSAQPSSPRAQPPSRPGFDSTRQMPRCQEGESRTDLTSAFSQSSSPTSGPGGNRLLTDIHSRRGGRIGREAGARRGRRPVRHRGDVVAAGMAVAAPSRAMPPGRRVVSWHAKGIEFFIPNPCRRKSRGWPDQRQRRECRLWTDRRGRCNHWPRNERLAR